MIYSVSDPKPRNVKKNLLYIIGCTPRLLAAVPNQRKLGRLLRIASYDIFIKYCIPVVDTSFQLKRSESGTVVPGPDPTPAQKVLESPDPDPQHYFKL